MNLHICKTKPKLFDLYKEWIEIGKLPDHGLCCSLMNTKYAKGLKLFEPELNEDLNHEPYWAYNGERCSRGNYYDDIYFDFTELRQTIILLICAINDEL